MDSADVDTRSFYYILSTKCLYPFSSYDHEMLSPKLSAPILLLAESFSKTLTSELKCVRNIWGSHVDLLPANDYVIHTLECKNPT